MFSFLNYTKHMFCYQEKIPYRPSNLAKKVDDSRKPLFDPLMVPHSGTKGIKVKKGGQNIIFSQF